MQHARKAASAASSLAQNQAVPRDHRPVRLPTYPSIERTSTCKFTMTKPLKVPSSSATTLMYFRTVKDCLWRSYTFNDGPVYWKCYYAATSTEFGNYPIRQGQELNFSLTLSSLGSPFVDGLLPTYPKVVTDDGLIWFYNPTCGTFKISFDPESPPPPTTLNANLTFHLERMTGFDKTTRTPLLLASQVDDGTVYAETTEPGFYRLVKLSADTDSGVTTPMNVTRVNFETTYKDQATQEALPKPSWIPFISVPPEWSSYIKVYSDSRITSSSFLLQNTTAVLSKEGSIEAVRVPVDNLAIFTNTALTVVDSALADSASSERYVGLLEKGFYGFCAPDSASMAFRDFTEGLQADSFDHVYFVRMTDYGGDSTNLLLSWDFHLEFRNASMLFDIGISSVPLEEWHRAQVALARIPFFYENFTHLATISAMARAAASRLAPYVVPVLKNAGNAALVSLANSAKGLATQALASQAMGQLVKAKAVKPKPKSGKRQGKKRKGGSK